MSLPLTDKLLEGPVFPSAREGDALFLESFREVAEKHLAGNAWLRGWWESVGLKPSDLVGIQDLERVPAPIVSVFKEWSFSSVPAHEIVLRLTSSGTGGEKSQMLLNAGSLSRVKRLAFRVHEALGLTSKEKVNYLCFTYDPEIAKDLGTAFTDELLTQFTERNQVVYAFQWDPEFSEFRMDPKHVTQTLDRFQEEGLPVRILGFPAFLHEILKENPRTYDFGPRSWVQTGGGWKSKASEEIPKKEFRRFVSSRLGIPVENVRDLFGMVEHGIPYVDCKKGRLHVPNFGRVLIRNPITGKIVSEGERGLVQFFCTYNDAYPTIAITSTDWGRLTPCDCGIPGHTLEILGRAGVTKHKGCAIQALEKIA